MINSKLTRFGIFVLILLALGQLYNFVYTPISYVNDVKEYNPLYIQGDVLTYINFAKNEIQGRSFFEWFLKLDSHSISLIYFAWMNVLLRKMNNSDINTASLVLALSALVVFSIGNRTGKNMLYTCLSLLSSFSLIIYMQTITKEIMILPFMFLALWGIQNKRIKTTIAAIFLLSLVRVYFSLTIIAALLAFAVYKKVDRKSFYSLLACGVFFFPLLFTKIFTSFTMLENVNSSFGIYSYYLLSLKSLGLYFFWLPLKVAQNFAEPILKFYYQPFSHLIFEAPILLDFLTSFTMLFLLVIIWNRRKQFRQSSDFTKFLLIFVACYLYMVASIPLVHFRYMVPLLPILGLVADQLNIERKPRVLI